MSFLLRLDGFSLSDRVKGLAIQGGLRVELLLYHIKRTQLRWFRHLMRMPLGTVSCACAPERKS